MYDRFARESMELIAVSQEEAEEWRHSYVGTEHLLLAFLRMKGTDVYRFLTTHNVTYAKAASILEEEKGRGEVRLSADDLEPTPRLKRVMKISFEEARRAGLKTIRPEHLLMGMLREGEGTGSATLLTLGIDLARTRAYFLPSAGISMAIRSSRRQPRKSDLSEFGRNLVEEADAGNLDPVIGRDEEMERIIQTLTRRKKNNPAVIGESGVGKTAIVEGLAQRIASGDVPVPLRSKEIIELNMASVVAGTKYRGEFEQRLKNLIDHVVESDNIILFIDELQTVVGAGGAEGAIDASSILKPPLASGAVQCIGTATPDEYRKSVEKDPALKRRFKTIFIEEPTIEETVEILKGLRVHYERHHGVQITDDALYQAARLSDRYVTDQFLPDKAIDVIDEAAARIKLQSARLPEEAVALYDNLEALDEQEREAVGAQDYEAAARLRDEKQQLEEQIREINATASQETADLHADGKDIAQMISMWTGVPIGHVQEKETVRMVHMEGKIHERLIGQDESVKAVSRSIRRAYAGVKNPRRPVGVFMFLGPTGVGKTELSKTLAEFLFGDEDALIRVDMSEYMERFSVSRLTGAPPGYVGYEEAGELTEKVRRRPYSVVLFDEIEKAHRDVFNILLQVMEDGILTDSQGRRVDFRNTVLIMTSNVGSEKITDRDTLGFSNQDVGSEESYQDMKDRVIGEVRTVFRPEFLNRLDDIIVFHQLSRDQVGEVAELMLSDLRDRLVEEHRITLTLDDSATRLLITKGYDPKYGARPMRRTIERLIENPISELILQGTFENGSTVIATAEDEEIAFHRSE